MKIFIGKEFDGVPKKYQKRFKQWLILTEDSHQWMLSDEELYNDYFKPNL